MSQNDHSDEQKLSDPRTFVFTLPTMHQLQNPHINHTLKTSSHTTSLGNADCTGFLLNASIKFLGWCSQEEKIHHVTIKRHSKLPVKKRQLHRTSTGTECSPFCTEPRTSLQKHLLSKWLEREPYAGCLNSCATAALNSFLWSSLSVIFSLPFQSSKITTVVH